MWLKYRYHFLSVLCWLIWWALHHTNFLKRKKELFPPIDARVVEKHWKKRKRAINSRYQNWITRLLRFRTFEQRVEFCIFVLQDVNKLLGMPWAYMTPWRPMEQNHDPIWHTCGPVLVGVGRRTHTVHMCAIVECDTIRRGESRPEHTIWCE